MGLCPLSLSEDLEKNTPQCHAYWAKQQHHSCLCHSTHCKDKHDIYHSTTKCYINERWSIEHIQVLQVSQSYGSYTTTHSTCRRQTEEKAPCGERTPDTHAQTNLSHPGYINHEQQESKTCKQSEFWHVFTPPRTHIIISWMPIINWCPPCEGELFVERPACANWCPPVRASSGWVTSKRYHS